MQQFKISPEGIKELRISLIKKSIPRLLIILAAGAAINYYTLKDIQIFIASLPIFIPLVIGSMVVGVYLGMKRQEELLNSYILSIDSNSISRVQKNTATITISLNEVSEIFQYSNRSFVIKGSSSLDKIAIPPQIENYSELEKLLNEIKPIPTINRVPFLQKYPSIISLGTLGLMAAVYISTNKLVVGISGTLLLLLLGYSFINIRRSKNIDTTVKRYMWVVLFLVISLLGSMYFKLTAP